MATWIVRDSTPGTGPLVAVKDLIDMAGLPTTAGSRAVADDALPAERDAACIAGLRAAIADGRARFAGKVNAPEFPAGLDWLNTDQPLSITQLRGKLVLLDFWTFC